jgi:ribosome biogenesis GTPase
LNHLLSLGWNARLLSEHTQSASHLRPARIIAVDRDSYLVSTDVADPASTQRVSVAGRLRHQGEAALAVGDWVGLHETRIDYVFARQSSFVRKHAGESSLEQTIAANVDITLVAMSLNDDFSPRRVERFVIAAWDAGSTPIVVLTKSDLVSETGAAIAALADVSAGCEIVVVSAITGQGIEELTSKIGPGKTAVLVGSSGVGKSSLVNAMLGHEQQSTAAIRELDAKGRHTTTRRELLLIPDTGGLIIDTPGMREFGVVASGEAEGFQQSFADVEALATRCAFRDCSHRSEPHCAVLAAIEEGELRKDRLASYFNLLRELAYNERRQDSAKQRDEAKRWKKLSVEYRQRTRNSPKS